MTLGCVREVAPTICGRAWKMPTAEASVRARRHRRRKPLPHHRIAIKLHDVHQLFNTLDPSPFHEKDLDDDAEEFIVSWVQEYHPTEPVSLMIHLSELPEDEDLGSSIEQAVHHHFAYRAKLNRLEFRRLMKQGRLSLFIGLSFLAGCLLISQLVFGHGDDAFLRIARESLTIGGWVAMWRPMQIYLYDWWPLRRRVQIFEKLSRMPVEVRKAE